MKRKNPKIILIDSAGVRELMEAAERLLPQEMYALFKAIIDSYAFVLTLLSRKRVAIGRLKQLLFGVRTEKTDAVLGGQTEGSTSTASAQQGAGPSGEDPDAPQQRPPRKGHGRNGANAYRGASQVSVPHPSLKAGDACPECQDGTLYEQTRPAVLVRIIGQAPVHATVYELQKLRCGLCGTLFTAPPPPDLATEKYDPTVASMIGLLKYGGGFPFHRSARLQASLGVPLPAATQWEIVSGQAQRIRPAHEELVRQAAQGDVVYNDDTTARILELMGKRAPPQAFAEDAADGSRPKQPPERKGLFTSGIVATRGGHRMALFFSGRKHAGENLSDVLAQRAQGLGPAIQMCDALARNLPAELETIVGNCLAHARRQFVDVAEHFHGPCQRVLEAFQVIYRNDALARKRQLSAEQRLVFHQAESGPVMTDLQAWLQQQFDDREVEPNSALGKAIAYLLKRWTKLTLFLRQPGAPLDNNICERALKKAEAD